MSSGYHRESEFIDRLESQLRHGPDPVTLLLSGDPAVGPVPGSPTILELAEAYASQVRNDDLITALAQARQQIEDAGELLAAYREAFAAWVGPTGFDVVMQRAVVRGYWTGTAWSQEPGPWQRIDHRLAAQMEADPTAWTVPERTAALGRLLAHLPDRFDHLVLTTEVDPMLEIGVRRAGGRAIPVTLRPDNSVSSMVAGSGVVQVVHLYGYWRALRAEDNRAVLFDPHRIAVPGDIVPTQVGNLLRYRSVYVLGPGPGRSVLADTLASLAARRQVVLRWGLPAGTDNGSGPLPTAGDPRSLTVYQGVEADRVFGQLADRLGAAGLPAPTTGNGGSQDWRVQQPELARRLGATPLRQPAENPNDLLHQLDFRFDWRLERQRNQPAPTLLFWPVRLRRPSVIHMVQTLVAAALSVHQVRVVLSLDDFGAPPRDTTAAAFARRIRDWFTLVSGSREPEIIRLSRFIEDNDVFAAPPGPGALLRATRPWAVAREYFGEFDPSAFSVLSAAKVVPDIEPEHALLHAREIVEALLNRSANRLLTPLTLWSHLNHLLLNCPASQTVTLGGDDERRFWAHWRDSTQEVTAHLYHPQIVNVTNESTLTYWDHADDLHARLRHAISAESWRDRNRYLPWLIHNALMLPEYLRTARGITLAGRPFDAWQDVLTAVGEDRGLLEPIAEQISALFLHSAEQ